MKVYVASPYDTVLRACNDNKRYARELALKALSQANEMLDSKMELFSPVMAFMNVYAHKSREEVMQRCFEEIDRCDVIFIPDVRFVKSSKGIQDEFSYGIKQGKTVIFYSDDMQEAFKKRAGNV
ncbi:hypothetical protein [Campylobacter curvus]|uniref:hypothetical protein n=1 Tax=Campylobacter curvus TaxID=200 RepID=UPI00146FEBEE|nr:hypothetical protein [Campylobacter curvus]